MSNFFIETVPLLLAGFLRHQVYAAPFLLFIEESGIPIPIPGDIIIAIVGYQVSRGHFSYVLAFVILLVGVLGGSSILFYLSYHYGHRLVLRVGKYIHLDEERLKIVEQKFKQYGPWVIIIGRHIPGFRIPITVFAGISKVSYRTFIISTAISVVPWIAFYLWLGARLGPRVTRMLTGEHGYLAFFIIPVIVLALFLYNIRQSTDKEKKKKR